MGPLDGACPAARDSGSVVRRALVRWCMPDLALAAAWVTLFYCLFLFQGYQKLFRDSDAAWHIRTGEAILATGELPRTDPYSFTMAGRPWLAWEWGADVAVGAVHRAAGLTGVAMLYGLAIAMATWLWFRLHWRAGGSFLLACAMAPLLLSTGNIHWLARPHVFSWLFLLAAVIYAERVAGASGAYRAATVRERLAIAAGMTLWANVHASFFLGPLIFAIYAAGAFLRPLVWDCDAVAEWHKARWYALAAITALAATLLNPYGWNLHLHLFRYLTDSALLNRIGEFQSFDFHAVGAGQIIAALLLAILGGTLALVQQRPERFLLTLVIAAAALRSARALPLVALLLLPLANASVTAWLRTAEGFHQRARQALNGFLAYSDNLRRLDAHASGWAIAWTVPVVLWGLLHVPAISARTGFPPDQFPVAAYAHVAQLPFGARLFAPDKFGGYLIYRYAGSRKVFFDGRSDLYGAEFLKEYGRMVQVRPGWRELWDSHNFTHALLPNDYSLIPALLSIGWQQVYRDGTATLMAARTGTK
jgi:hypothetical protein